MGGYLANHLQGEWQHLKLVAFSGGQSNPTYLLRAGPLSYVLRKQPPGRLLPSAHAVDREYRIIWALSATNVPVPRAIHFCSDAKIIGTPFYIMEHVAGRVFRDTLLPQLPVGERTAIYDAMNLTLSRLHNVDYAALGLQDFGKPGNYFRRQIDRWGRQYRDSGGATIPAMEILMQSLPGLAPEDDRSSIVHGDFRLENLIIHPTEPVVVAVIDWELSTLGHPLADLAYNCFYYHLPHSAFGSFGDIELEGTGIPTEAEYIERYFDRTGIRPLAPWGFYVAFALFRLAAILHGVLQRALAGNAHSPEAMEQGRLATLCANVAVQALPN